MIEETAEEMRLRIESRDGRMKEDLQQNFSGRQKGGGFRMIKSVRGVVRFYYDVEIEVPYGVCESGASLDKRLKGKAMDAPAECIIERGVYVLEMVGLATDNIQEVDGNA